MSEAFAEWARHLDRPAVVLAGQMGVHSTVITQWRRPRNPCEPTDTNLVRLARALDQDVAGIAALCDSHQDPGDLRRARWAARLTVPEVAERLGVALGTVKGWEADGDAPPAAMREQVAELYGVDIGSRRVRGSERPGAPFAYPGIKSGLADSILGHLPVADAYVEPFGGTGSVLLARQPSTATREVLNDIDGEIIGLFRILRDPAQAEELHRRLSLTLYARAEYDEAVRVMGEANDPMLRAWAMFVMLGQSFRGIAIPHNWDPRGHVAQWWKRVAWTTDWHERLATVILEQDTAERVIARWDTERTVFYVDPPYVPETRTNRRFYRHELSLDDHQDLVDQLLAVKGAVVLSGYANPLYDQLDDAGWRRHGLKRRELIWTNPHAQHLLEAA